MDVELADPKLVSLDNLLALVGVSLVGLGGYLVFTEVGTQVGLAGWALAAAGWLVVFPRVLLGLELVGDAVRVSVMSGQRSFPVAEIEDVHIVEGRLRPRLGAVVAARYHTGPWRLASSGPVEAYASRMAGTFVVLERDQEPDVVLSPRDPAGFREALADRS